MNEWRLLPLIEANAARQMAIDEAILTARIEGFVKRNTLRFYTWKPPAISLGYFQSVEQEVNLEAIKKFGIDLVRRITGGGAVFHDKELTYSLIVSEKCGIIPKNIQKSYEVICGAIVNALKNEFGLNAEFKPINDILVNNKKISGSAQTRRDGVILQHGTILLDVDVKKMFSLLKVSNEKIKDKLIKSVEERVTSLRREINKEVKIEEVREALIKGFENKLHVSFSNLKGENLTPKEEELAKKFYEEKYSRKEWNFKR